MAIFNSKLLVITRGSIPLNPIKPPFSYGFPSYVSHYQKVIYINPTISCKKTSPEDYLNLVLLERARRCHLSLFLQLYGSMFATRHGSDQYHSGKHTSANWKSPYFMVNQRFLWPFAIDTVCSITSGYQGFGCGKPNRRPSLWAFGDGFKF